MLYDTGAGTRVRWNKDEERGVAARPGGGGREGTWTKGEKRGQVISLVEA